MRLVLIESTSIIAEVPEVNKLILVSRQCDATRDKQGYQGNYYVHKKETCESPGCSSPSNFPVMRYPTFKLVRTWKRERPMTGIPETRVQLFQSIKDDQELTWRIVRPEAVIHSEVRNSSDLPQWILCDRFDALVVQSNYVQAQNSKLSGQKLLIPELVRRAAERESTIAERDSIIAHSELDLSMRRAEIQSLLNKTHRLEDKNLALMEKIAEFEEMLLQMQSLDFKPTFNLSHSLLSSNKVSHAMKSDGGNQSNLNQWSLVWCILAAFGTALIFLYLYCACRLFRKYQEGKGDHEGGIPQPGQPATFKVKPMKDWKSNKMTQNSYIDEVHDSDSDLFEGTDAGRDTPN